MSCMARVWDSEIYYSWIVWDIPELRGAVWNIEGGQGCDVPM
jgi:hypothetical protein